MFSRLGAFLQNGSPHLVAGALLAALLLAVLVAPLRFLLSCFAGLMAALLVLVRPPREALPLILAAAALCFIPLLLAGALDSLLAYLIFLFAPPILLAFALRAQGLAVTILCAFLGSWALAQILYLMPSMVPDWEAVMKAIAEANPGAARMQASAWMEFVRDIGLELLLTTFALLGVLVLLLARSWQSALAETRFFRDEFRALNFGKYFSGAFLALLALLPFLGHASPLWLGMSLTFLMIFAFQAAATAHRLSDRIRTPGAMLVPFYALLLVFRESVLVFGAASAIDNLLGLSRRLPPTRPHPE